MKPPSNEAGLELSRLTDKDLTLAESLMKRIRKEGESNTLYLLCRQLLEIGGLSLQHPRLLVFAHFTELIYVLLNLPCIPDDGKEWKASLTIRIDTAKEDDSDIEVKFDGDTIRKGDLQKVILKAGRDAPHHLAIRVPKGIPSEFIDIPPPVCLEKLCTTEKKKVWQSCSVLRCNDLLLVTDGSSVGTYLDPSEYEGPRVDSRRVLEFCTKEDNGLGDATCAVDAPKQRIPQRRATHKDSAKNTKDSEKEVSIGADKQYPRYRGKVREWLPKHIKIAQLRATVNSRFQLLIAEELKSLESKLLQCRRNLQESKASFTVPSLAQLSLSDCLKHLGQEFAQTASDILEGRNEKTILSDAAGATLEDVLEESRAMVVRVFPSGERGSAEEGRADLNISESFTGRSKCGELTGLEAVRALLSWTSDRLWSLRLEETLDFHPGESSFVAILRKLFFLLQLSLCASANIMQRTFDVALAEMQLKLRQSSMKKLLRLCEHPQFRIKVKAASHDFCV